MHFIRHVQLRANHFNVWNQYALSYSNSVCRDNSRENPCQVHLIGIAIITFGILSGLAREVKRAWHEKGLSQQGTLTQAAETGEINMRVNPMQNQSFIDGDDDDEIEEHPLMALYDAISYGPDPSEDEEYSGQKIMVFHDADLHKVVVGDI